MAIKDILLLGNPLLYQISKPVELEELPLVNKTIEKLHESIVEIRKVYGFGRGIAAPQIGVMKRIIYMLLEEPIVFINPVITKFSDDKFTLWDDCMSFPDLLVKVERYKTCDVEYFDLNWTKKQIHFEDDLSELFQHEYDHLDGILAVQRAIDLKSFSLNSQKHLLL